MKHGIKSMMPESPKDFSAFEEQLAEALQPVKPPDQFVRELRGKLIEELRSSAPGSRISTRNLAILILAGILSVVLFIVAGVRLILSIFGGLTLMRKFRPSKDRPQGNDSADQEAA